MTIRWRGRDGRRREQIANARDDHTDLTPASDTPAADLAADWAAWLPGEPTPLIWENQHDHLEEDDRPHPRHHGSR